MTECSFHLMDHLQATILARGEVKRIRNARCSLTVHALAPLGLTWDAVIDIIRGEGKGK